MQNLSLVHILALATIIKRKILQRWKVIIPQKPEITYLPSQVVPIGHVFPATVSVLGSQSTCFSETLQTWGEEHHNAVEDSHLAEQNNVLLLSGDSFTEQANHPWLNHFGFGVFMVIGHLFCAFHVFLWITLFERNFKVCALALGTFLLLSQVF